MNEYTAGAAIISGSRIYERILDSFAQNSL
jgi:hypothetical protein